MKEPRSYLWHSSVGILLSLLLVGVWPTSVSAATQLLALRVVHQENLVIHIDLDQKPVDERFFSLAGPDRLVIDLAETTMDKIPVSRTFPQGVVKGVRYGVQDKLHLRLVVDLRQTINATYQYIVKGEGVRLVVNLGVKGDPSLADSKSQITIGQEPPKKASQPVKVLKPRSPPRQLVVVIDAGHGGKDPGAIGRKKTREKIVTLQIAQQLYKRLSKEKGVKPLLVRNKDEYVSLRDRLRFARENRADLFISIHADAVPRKTAVGSSVYALSLNEASSETAKWLAAHEKTSDLFGDVELDGRAPDLQETLLAMARSSTLESSITLGRFVIAELAKIGPMHKVNVEFANFAVLKSPDIPSILVETAFISNPREERKLRSRRYRDKLARALQTSIMNYFIQRAPSGTIFADANSGSRGG